MSENIKVNGLTSSQSVKASENSAAVLMGRTATGSQGQGKNNEVDDNFVDSLISKEAQANLIEAIKNTKIVNTSESDKFMNQQLK